MSGKYRGLPRVILIQQGKTLACLWASRKNSSHHLCVNKEINTGYNTLTTVELITRQEIARYKRSNNIKYKKKRIKSWWLRSRVDPFEEKDEKTKLIFSSLLVLVQAQSFLFTPQSIEIELISITRCYQQVTQSYIRLCSLGAPASQSQHL